MLDKLEIGCGEAARRRVSKLLENIDLAVRKRRAKISKFTFHSASERLAGSIRCRAAAKTGEPRKKV